MSSMAKIRLIDKTEYGMLIDEQLRFYQPKELNPFHNKILELQRELLDSIPTIDAIPVDWLESMLDKTAVTNVELNNAIFHVLCAWEREKQEAT